MVTIQPYLPRRKGSREAIALYRPFNLPVIPFPFWGCRQIQRHSGENRNPYAPGDGQLLKFGDLWIPASAGRTKSRYGRTFLLFWRHPLAGKDWSASENGSRLISRPNKTRLILSITPGKRENQKTLSRRRRKFLLPSTTNLARKSGGYTCYDVLEVGTISKRW